MCQPDHFPIGDGMQQAFDLYPGISGWSGEDSVIFRAAPRETLAHRTSCQGG